MRLLASVPVVAVACLALSACGDENQVSVKVPSRAMAPTYKVGETLDVDQAAYKTARPKVGDVVVFRAPRGAETGRCGATRTGRRACAEPTPPSANLRFLMRVVAGPRDTIAFEGGRAVRDGKREKQKGVRVSDPNCASCNLTLAVTVPKRHFFMAGDNRSDSADSRDFGPVPRKSIVGKVLD